MTPTRSGEVSGARATTSSGGEADVPTDEMAEGVVNKEGDAKATASSSGETSEPKKKGQRRAKGLKTHDARKRQQRRTAAGAADDP